MPGDSRPYEQQVIEALKTIARGVGASGVSSSGGSSASSPLNSTSVANIITAINGVASRVDGINSLLEILRTIMVYDDEEEGMHFKSGVFADSYVVAGGVSDESGGGGGGPIRYVKNEDDFSYPTNPFSVYSEIDTFNAYAINQLHIRITDLENAPAGGVISVAGLTGEVQASDLVSALGLSSALKFRGTTTSDIVTDPTTNPIYINGSAYTAQSGDVVVMDGSSQEYMWNGSVWQPLGDESSYALKTISITGTGYLTGGGTLEQSRTIDIDSTYKSYIDHGESAYNRTDWDLYFGVEALTGDIYVKPNGNDTRVFRNDGAIVAGGVSPGGGGGGGLEVKEVGEFANPNPFSEHSEIDTFNAYAIDQLHIRISALESAPGGVSSVTGLTGDITEAQLAAQMGVGSITSGEDSLVSGGTVFTYVTGNYLPLTGGTLTGALRLKPASANYGNTIYFGNESYVYITNGANRALTMYAANGITISSATSVTEAFTVGLYNSYKKTTLYGDLDVYGNTVHGGTISMPNNKAINWYATNSALIKILNFNASNQIELGAGLVMDTSGNITISGATSISGTTSISGATTITNTLTIGSASSYKKTTMYGALDVYGDLTLGSSIILPNNKPIKWYNSAGSATVDIINYNASNQVVLGAGLTMDASGNVTLSANNTFSGDTTIAHSKGIKFKNSVGTERNGISMVSNILVVGSSYQVTGISGQRIDLYYDGGIYGETLGMRLSQTTGRTVIYKGLSLNGTNSDNTEAYIDFDNHAFHIHGNLYVDGYVTSGGIGSEDDVVTGTTTFNNRALVLTNDYSASSPKYVNLVVDGSNVLHFYSNKTTTSSWANLKCNSVTQVSDVRLKENILSLSKDYAIEKLMQLKPVTWTWNKESCYNGKVYAGFVAQDVEPVIPQMVSSDSGKYLGLDYAMLHAFEVAGLQSHEARIAALERENEELRRRLGYE